MAGAALGLALVLLLAGCAGTATATPDDKDGPTVRRRTDRTDRRKDTRSDRGGRKPTGKVKKAPKEEPPDLGPELAKAQEEIAALQKEKADLESTIAVLKETGEGGNTALIQQLDELKEEKRQAEAERDTATQALLDREEQFKEQRETLEQQVESLRNKLDNLGGGGGYDEIADELEKLRTDYDVLKADLAAKETANKGLMASADGLRKQNKRLEEEKQALVDVRDAAIADKEALEKEREELLAQNRQLMKDVTEGQSERAEAIQNIEKRVSTVETKITQAETQAGVATAAMEGEVRERKKISIIALIGLVIALGALMMGIWLFRESKNIRYQVAFNQAQGGGGVDPAELDSIVSARISEVADNLQVAGGGDLEGLGERIKQALDSEVKSEEFQNLVKATVIQNAKNAGGGDGGGGLSPEDVKVMVDNQFRAITTYLKNEAVPKMVEDALKRRGE
jgi:hypothetical protein